MLQVHNVLTPINSYFSGDYFSGHCIVSCFQRIDDTINTSVKRVSEVTAVENQKLVVLSNQLLSLSSEQDDLCIKISKSTSKFCLCIIKKTIGYKVGLFPTFDNKVQLTYYAEAGQKPLELFVSSKYSDILWPDDKEEKANGINEAVKAIKQYYKEYGV